MTRAGEEHCRDVILGRTLTVCEGCRVRSWTDKAHRVAASGGGQWTPPNVIGLCRSCHAWAHANPTHAAATGWMLPSGTDPTTAPVFLVSASLTVGWYLLDAAGGAASSWGPDGTDDPPAMLPSHFPARTLLPPPRVVVPAPRTPPP